MCMAFITFKTVYLHCNGESRSIHLLFCPKQCGKFILVEALFNCFYFRHDIHIIFCLCIPVNAMRNGSRFCILNNVMLCAKLSFQQNEYWIVRLEATIMSDYASILQQHRHYQLQLTPVEQLPPSYDQLPQAVGAIKPVLKPYAKERLVVQ